MSTYEAHIDFAHLPGCILPSLDTIERFADRLDWAIISAAKTLYPRWFICKHAARFDWSIFSKRRELDEAFVLEQPNLIVWPQLSTNRRFLASASDHFFYAASARLDWGRVFEALGREFQWVTFFPSLLLTLSFSNLPYYPSRGPPSSWPLFASGASTPFGQ